MFAGRRRRNRFASTHLHARHAFTLAVRGKRARVLNGAGDPIVFWHRVRVHARRRCSYSVVEQP